MSVSNESNESDDVRAAQQCLRDMQERMDKGELIKPLVALGRLIRALNFEESDKLDIRDFDAKKYYDRPRDKKDIYKH